MAEKSSLRVFEGSFFFGYLTFARRRRSSRRSAPLGHARTPSRAPRSENGLRHDPGLPPPRSARVAAERALPDPPRRSPARSRGRPLGRAPIASGPGSAPPRPAGWRSVRPAARVAAFAKKGKKAAPEPVYEDDEDDEDDEGVGYDDDERG